MNRGGKAARAVYIAIAGMILLPGADFLLSNPALAAGGPHEVSTATVFLWIVIILLAAKVGSLVDRFAQPVVLGELIIGIALGNLALLGIEWLEPLESSQIIIFLAELGVVILLFQIGLESSVETMMKVGMRAFTVAVIGVVCPFLLGTWLVGPWLMPGLSFNAYLFLGATLTATSVGITGRVFRDLGQLQAPAAQIVLGAAVIDDVLGLVILAVVSAIVSTGSMDALGIGIILGKAIAFLLGALLIGRAVAPRISRLFARIHTGVGMKFTLVISTCLIFAFIAHLVGLAPIVGAFAAGLVLDEVHFEEFERPDLYRDIRSAVESADPSVQSRVDQALAHHGQKHMEHLIEPVGHFLVPFFFVVTGMQVKLDVLANLHAVGIALALTAAAVIGKLVSGLAAGKGSGWLVGWGMVPRGEVGLIFAAVGKNLGVVDDEAFAVIVIMVILTTLITPPILAALLRRKNAREGRDTLAGV
jgi:Kef-type K+ transport system membrane component KefB